ncbi:hypothetical protein D3C78_1497110 [compost metagenome]
MHKLLDIQKSGLSVKPLKLMLNLRHWPAATHRVNNTKVITFAEIDMGVTHASGRRLTTYSDRL